VQRNESVTEFVAALRAIMLRCRYPVALQETILCDRLVAGLRDETLRRKLVEGLQRLAEADRDLAHAIELALLNESIEAAFKQEAAARSTPSVNAVSAKSSGSTFTRGRGAGYSRGRYVRDGRDGYDRDGRGSRSGYRPRASRDADDDDDGDDTCERCGREDHLLADCQFSAKVVCRKCRKQGHLSRVCRFAEESPSPPPSASRDSTKASKTASPTLKAHHVTEPDEFPEFNYVGSVFETCTSAAASYDDHHSSARATQTPQFTASWSSKPLYEQLLATALARIARLEGQVAHLNARPIVQPTNQTGVFVHATVDHVAAAEQSTTRLDVSEGATPRKSDDDLLSVRDDASRSVSAYGGDAKVNDEAELLSILTHNVTDNESVDAEPCADAALHESKWTNSMAAHHDQSRRKKRSCKLKPKLACREFNKPH
jgi:hypothetical protein